MIPVTLKLQNFLSYGQECPVLDFRAFRMACLSGRNGHGKSALLDAMTWAIWGEARKAGYSRTPDGELIRQNAEEMSVDFVFELNDRLFRVFRSYRRGKRSGTLEFYSRSTTDEDWNVFSGSGKTDTQKKITETLGIDYKTFVSSSFLQQGKADAFTRQSPRDRKEILGTILGLGVYDRLRDESHVQLTRCRDERIALEERLQTFGDELENEDEIQREHLALQDALVEIESKRKAIVAREELLRAQKSTLDQLHQQQKRLEREIEETRQRIGSDGARLFRLNRERTTCRSWIERRETIEANKTRLESVNEQLKELLAAEAERDQLQQERLTLQEQVDAEALRLREEVASGRAKIEALERSIAEADQLIQQKDRLQREWEELSALREQESRLQDQHKKYEEASRAIEALDRSIQEEANRLHNQIAELRGKCEPLPRITQEYETARTNLESLPACRKRVEALVEQEEVTTKEGQDQAANLKALELQITNARSRQEELRQRRRKVEEGVGDTCSLCGAPVTEDRRSHLLDHLAEEERELLASHDAMSREKKKLENDIETLRKSYTATRNERKKEEDKLVRLQQVESGMETLRKEMETLQEQEAKAKSLRETVEQGAFALEERAQRDAVMRERDAIGYDAAMHADVMQQYQSRLSAEHEWKQVLDEEIRQAERTRQRSLLQTQYDENLKTLQTNAFLPDIRKKIQHLDQAIQPLNEHLKQRPMLQETQSRYAQAHSDWNQLNEATRRLPEIETEELELQKQLDDLKSRIPKLEKELLEIEPQLAKRESVEKQIADVLAERVPVEQERDATQQRLGAVQGLLERIRTIRQQQGETRTRLKQVVQDMEHYQALKRAFSRDGIPAMIVEEALPELEADANRLLHRLSNGACSLALESQRERKSGGAVETLDIRISDEMGTRDYELFSGGEAFRADLSLRIALSQLLCRRAGSRLQLLVIDEGFGTQDAEGLSRIVDAIEDIQDEFEKILVVTHLEELKERFFVRIEVTKEPGIGSHFELIHTI